MATPHNKGNIQDIAKTVLMPGDPLRAQYIAENFLEDAVKFTDVRNMYGFTGYYKGKRVTVMGHGMGMPSIGIYTHELFNFYDVDTIIRIGSAGAICKKVELRDLLFAMGASTDSNYAMQYGLPGTFAPIATYSLLEKAVETAKKLDIKYTVGNVISTDVFYNNDEKYNDKWADMGVLAVEMEAAALYMEAAKAGKNALCMLTISDHLVDKEYLSTEERQTGFTNMMKVALEMI